MRNHAFSSQPADNSGICELLTLKEGQKTTSPFYDPVIHLMNAVFTRVAELQPNSSQSHCSILPTYDLDYTKVELPLGGIVECCRLAYQIYTDDTFGASDIIVRLEAMKGYLELTSIPGDWLEIPGALLWCLIVGVCWAYGDQALYPWFVSQLLGLSMPLCIQRWEKLQHFLCWAQYAVKRAHRSFPKFNQGT